MSDDLFAELTPSDKVEVQMHDRLAGCGAAVRDDAVAFMKAFRGGNGRNGLQAGGGGIDFEQLAARMWDPMQRQSTIHGASMVAFTR